MIISKTPFRVSFFGGGTDYPEWYAREGGAVLSTTIDKYCYLTCRYLPPFFDFKYRVVWSKVENRKGAAEIEHPVVRCLLDRLCIERGVEIHHFGDLPARSLTGTVQAHGQQAGHDGGGEMECPGGEGADVLSGRIQIHLEPEQVCQAERHDSEREIQADKQESRVEESSCQRISASLVLFVGRLRSSSFN